MSKLTRMFCFADEVTFSWPDSGLSCEEEYDLSQEHQDAIESIIRMIKDKPLEARMVIEHPPESERTHYHKEVKRIQCECGRSHRVYIDVYAVLRAFKVVSHIVGHAIKKLLAAGSRGSKPYTQDIAEAGQSIEAEKRSIEDWV